MSKKDIVELEMDEDGAYAPKGTVRGKKSKKREMIYGYTQKQKPTIFRENHADDFLGGIDAGLDFIENIIPRAERFLRLRG